MKTQMGGFLRWWKRCRLPYWVTRNRAMAYDATQDLAWRAFKAGIRYEQGRNKE